MAARATANIAVVLGKFKEELTCPICQEILKEPKSLPCLHSFCQKCLDDYIRLRPLNNEEGAPPDTRDIVPCPKCKFQAQLEPVGGQGEPGNIVASLKTNACLKNLVSHYKIAQEVVTERGTRCDFCSVADNKAVAFCQTQCNQFLCQPCSDSHKRMTISSGHTIVTLEDVRSSGTSENAPPVLRSYRTRKCSEHFTEGRDNPNERMTDINIYCFPCKKVICCMCAITEHQPHDPKRVASSVINDPEHRPLLEAKVKETEEVKEKLYTSSVKLHERKFRIEDARQKTETRIKEVDFEKLKLELERGKEALLLRIKNIHEHHLRNLRLQRKALGDRRAAIKHTIDFIDRRLTLGSPEDIVYFNKEMTQQISRLVRESQEHPPQHAYKRIIQFVHKEQNMAGVMGNVSAKPIYTADEIHNVDFARHREVEFTITARDTLTNEATADVDTLLVELQPVGQPADQVIRAKVTKLRNGKCLATLKPQTTGDHTLSIQVATAGQFQHIQNSPFHIKVAVNPAMNLYI